MTFFSNDVGASLRQRFSGSPPTARPVNLFWQQPTKALLLTLRSGTEGLTASEAARRLEETGPNAFHEPIRPRLLAKSAKRVLNPLIAILLVAAAIIVMVVAGSITLDIVQEHHAEVAVETLRRSVAVVSVEHGGAQRSRPSGLVFLPAEQRERATNRVVY
jgi:magnesium-transporting ATPase (P-type)